ncbi:MAG: GDSL-type esterase/lipase family protein, partial [Acidimicrobiia bacterium]
MFLLIASVMPLGIPVAKGFSAPIRVMAVGNSITRGVVGSTDAAGYRNDLYASLTASGYAIDMVGSQADGIGFDNAHEGHNGWRANQIRDGVSAWLDLNPADIVLLHVGTNDISDEQSVPAIATEINQILNKIDTWEQSPGNNEIRVVLARIVNRSDPTSPTGLATSALNAAIQTMADSRITTGDHLVVVDMEAALDYPDDMSDALHP